METAALDSAEFSLTRLGELCRLREYCDCYADRLTKRALQAAIFSVYLDCRTAGVSDRARQILVEWCRKRSRRRLARAQSRSD